MSTIKPHIVLLTAWFPPKQGVAVQRMSAFAKYLPAEKYDMTVITDGIKESSDESIFNRVRVERFVVNAPLSKAGFIRGENRFFHYAKVAWNRLLALAQGPVDRAWATAAVNRLRLLHDSQPIDLIISSYSPAATHVAAAEFCSQNPDVKWIADMRDEMSLNPYFLASEKKGLAKVETLVDSLAVAVTSVSQPILDDFQRSMHRVTYFEEIRNGFDHDQPYFRHFNEVFTIRYAGSFYGKTKPDTFFAGLELFLKRNPVEINLSFVGTHRNFTVPKKLKDVCGFSPQITPDEFVKSISHSDANLLILPKINRRGVYSGKLFDYLSVGRPIIAVVDPHDVAARLIRQCKAGFVADFDHPEDICAAIEGAYLVWKERRQMEVDVEAISQLHRRYQVQKLDRLIDKILAA